MQISYSIKQQKLGTNTGAFTIIELMVSIVIFTVGFLGAYLLIESASTVSARSKDQIVGGNLMREQIELLKNLRDTNWIGYRQWNSIEKSKEAGVIDTKFGSGLYTIENDFGTTKTISIKKLSGLSTDQPSILSAIRTGAPAINLCIDGHNRYTHLCTPTSEKTTTASFLHIEPLMTQDISNTKIPVTDAFKVTVYYVNTAKGYRIYTMTTILTDWKK